MIGVTGVQTCVLPIWRESAHELLVEIPKGDAEQPRARACGLREGRAGGVVTVEEALRRPEDEPALRRVGVRPVENGRLVLARSEERRVGQQLKSRWWP